MSVARWNATVIDSPDSEPFAVVGDLVVAVWPTLARLRHGGSGTCCTRRERTGQAFWRVASVVFLPVSHVSMAR